MKSLLFKINLSLLLLLVASFSFAQNSDDIQFEKTTQKFMRVDEGHQITLSYNFTYNGKVDLKITPPKVDCSCTEVVLPEDDIKPNSTNTIKIKFDTSDKIGWQERKVIIQFMGNLSEISRGPYFEKTLTFKGMVKASKITKDAYKLNKRKK
jgi:hypothetical protein